MILFKNVVFNWYVGFLKKKKSLNFFSSEFLLKFLGKEVDFFL